MSFRNRVTEAYPVSHEQIRRANPNTSFPAYFEQADGHDWVQPTQPPAFDPMVQHRREGDPQKQGDKWVQTWAVESLAPEQVAANIEAAKARLAEAATAKRWTVETGGMVLPGDIHVATGTEDQNRITSVIANAQRAGVETVDFKAESGWLTLTLAQVQGIASAIALHVQACFSAERAHHEAIAMLTTAQGVTAYDVNAGWPSNTGGV